MRVVCNIAATVNVRVCWSRKNLLSKKNLSEAISFSEARKKVINMTNNTPKGPEGEQQGFASTYASLLPTAPQDEHDATGFMMKMVSHLPANQVVALCTTWQPPGKDDILYPAQRWRGDSIVSDDMTHFSIGLMQPQTGQKFRRRNEFWTGAIGVLLDDVFEKVTGDKVPTLPPTAKVLTKPGSEQWLYLYNEILTSVGEAETIIHSIHAAGLSDPGSKGRIRLGRLPGSLPLGKVHRARLLDFSGPRYNASELLSLLRIPEVQHTGGATMLPVDAAFLSDDPVEAWLQVKGYVRSVHAGGWMKVVCPWIDDHSHHDPSGSSYKSPTSDDAQRVFNCYHSCGNRTQEFLAWVYDQGGPAVGQFDQAAINRQREAKQNA